jgi:hypothetical protein
LRLQVVGPDVYFGGGDDDNLVEIYDLTALPGLGGAPGSGNTVVAGTQRQGSGSFARLNTLQPGDEITLTYRGQSYRYSAIMICRAASSEFARIVGGGPPERITLIQGASGSAPRLYAVAERQANTVATACPAGSPA